MPLPLSQVPTLRAEKFAVTEAVHRDKLFLGFKEGDRFTVVTQTQPISPIR